MLIRGRSALAQIPGLSCPSVRAAGLPLASLKLEGCVVVRSYCTSDREQRLFSRMKASSFTLPSLARHMSSLPPHVPLSMPALSPTMTAGNIGKCLVSRLRPTSWHETDAHFVSLYSLQATISLSFLSFVMEKIILRASFYPQLPVSC
jgi:hypothetical protein